MKVFSISVLDIDKKSEILQEIVTEVVAILVNNINFQINKIDKLPTDPKTVIPEKNHNSLDVFSKEISNTVTAHSKYNYKIWLLKSHKNYNYSLLHEMLQKQLKFIKKFFENNLKKNLSKPVACSTNFQSY